MTFLLRCVCAENCGGWYGDTYYDTNYKHRLLLGKLQRASDEKLKSAHQHRICIASHGEIFFTANALIFIFNNFKSFYSIFCRSKIFFSNKFIFSSSSNHQSSVFSSVESRYNFLLRGFPPVTSPVPINFCLFQMQNKMSSRISILTRQVRR